MTEPIRILHVLGGTNLGGAESRIMDLYRHMDRSKIQFDFLVHTEKEGYFDKEIKELGGRIYRVPRFRLYNYFTYKKAVKEFFRKHHEFRAVQGHITSTAAIYLPIARKWRVPVTIAHARSAGVDKGIKGTVTRLLRKNLSKKTDYMFTCSRIAGISVFGEKAVKEGKTVFIPNAIDCQAFAYDESKREEMRSQLGLSDKYVIGHVGRFHYAKNHEYLLKVFAALCRMETQRGRAYIAGRNYALILLGEGGGKQAALELARELGIEDKVYFLGSRSNVYDYYQAMDFFVYPSRFEGLPGTVVEAQASGLKCVISDTICKEVMVTDLVRAMSTQEDPAKWAQYIAETGEYQRKSRVEELCRAGFDVNEQARIMTDFYLRGSNMADKRKLMLISPMLHQGGFERVCITTARLMEPYFDVTIVIFNSANIAYDVEGLKIIDLNLGVRKGKVKKILNILKRSSRLRKLKKEMRPEIAYSFGPTANMVNAFSKTKQTKVWLGLRNYTDVEEKVKIRLFTRLADLMICCSKTIEDELNIKFKFNKTTTLYNLYDVKAIRKEAEEKEPELPWGDTDKEGRRLRYLVSMGRDDDMKGFWHMLKVFSIVQTRIPEARLILLGAGTFDKYRKLAEDLGISQKVCFAGMQREPYKYLKKGEVYLLTSQNEGFPNALVEGMSLGLAAVCVDCMTGPAEILLENGDTSLFAQQRKNGKTPVIYGEYGILVPVMEKERDLDAAHISEEERSMAEIVTDLMLDEDKLLKYQKAALSRAQIFTYENYVEKFLSLS